MRKLTSQSTIKSTSKNGHQRLPIADLEKLLGQAEKNSAHAVAEVARIQALLDGQKHAHRMELGGQAILRRLVFLNDKAWSGLSGRLGDTLPEDSDHDDLMYWLGHRPHPEDPSPQPAEKSASPNRQDAKLKSAENPPQEPSQVSPSNGEGADKISTASAPGASGQRTEEPGSEAAPTAENR